MRFHTVVDATNLLGVAWKAAGTGSDDLHMRHKSEFPAENTVPAAGVVGSNDVARNSQGTRGFHNFQVPFPEQVL